MHEELKRLIEEAGTGMVLTMGAAGVFLAIHGPALLAAVELAEAGVMYQCTATLANLPSDPMLVWGRKLMNEEAEKRADEVNKALEAYRAAKNGSKS